MSGDKLPRDAPHLSMCKSGAVRAYMSVNRVTLQPEALASMSESKIQGLAYLRRRDRPDLCPC